MKKLTNSQVAAFIIKHQSAEFTDNTITYYLYLNQDGELHDGISGSAADFSHVLPYADYNIDVDSIMEDLPCHSCDMRDTLHCNSDCSSYYDEKEKYTERWETIRDRIYEHEEEGDPIFDKIVRNLTEQANAWIKENA